MTQVSICLNTAATLIILEVDNCLFSLVLDDRQQAACLEIGCHVTPAEYTRLTRSKYIHCLAAAAATLGVVIFSFASSGSARTPEELSLYALGIAFICCVAAELQLTSSACSSRFGDKLYLIVRAVFTGIGSLLFVSYFLGNVGGLL